MGTLYYGDKLGAIKEKTRRATGIGAVRTDKTNLIDDALFEVQKTSNTCRIGTQTQTDEKRRSMSGKPMTKREVRKCSKERLTDMGRAGIKFVEILGDKVAGEACDVCRDLEKRKMEIELAVPLPLPGCDKKYCKCIWRARQ